MHHTAGVDTGFLNRGVYRSDPRYEKGGGGAYTHQARSGGGGGSCTLKALYPPPYGTYLLD